MRSIGNASVTTWPTQRATLDCFVDWFGTMDIATLLEELRALDFSELPMLRADFDAL